MTLTASSALCETSASWLQFQSPQVWRKLQVRTGTHNDLCSLKAIQPKDRASTSAAHLRPRLLAGAVDELSGACSKRKLPGNKTWGALPGFVMIIDGLHAKQATAKGLRAIDVALQHLSQVSSVFLRTWRSTLPTSLRLLLSDKEEQRGWSASGLAKRDSEYNHNEELRVSICCQPVTSNSAISCPRPCTRYHTWGSIFSQCRDSVSPVASAAVESSRSHSFCYFTHPPTSDGALSTRQGPRTYHHASFPFETRRKHGRTHENDEWTGSEHPQVAEPFIIAPAQLVTFGLTSARSRSNRNSALALRQQPPRLCNRHGLLRSHRQR